MSESGQEASGLHGQVALITGASRGIGLHLATALARQGMAVAGLARNEDRLRAALEGVSADTGSPTLALAGDVTDPDPVSAAVAATVERFGPIDLLINNAGLVDAAEVPLWESDPDQWWSVVVSHVRGAQLTIASTVPAMVERGRGRVVNLASGMGTRPDAEYSAYAVAKAAQMRLTESLAAGLEGTGVYAFNVAPGLVQTEMTASMRRWDTQQEWTSPEAVVELVCAVASGQADHWSGRFLRAGVDRPESLDREVNGPDRQLRLKPYGRDDPLG